jgi:catechol 2,3-dioxygenase-like lactoylglutathione lyase family enzyme
LDEQRVIRGLGEVGLRVNDLDRMAKFYEHVVGLEPWRRLDFAVFFRIADGFQGHTRAFVLFDRSSSDPVPPRADASTLDHFAFEIALDDYEPERARLEESGVSVRTREFPDFGWRGLFFEDPEGNTVEFVCYDERV